MSKVKVYNNNDKGESIHEFTIYKELDKKAKSTKYQMYYSEHDVWTEHTKGMPIMTYVDDGNGLKFDTTEFNNNFKSKKFEYNEAYYMFIMLKFIQKEQKYHKFKFKKCKK